MKESDAMMIQKGRRFGGMGLLLPVAPLFLALAWAGCSKEAPKRVEPPETAKIEPERVTFTANAPQLAAVAVQVTTPRTNSVTHVTGRLYWNDETTVRVFTPVQGRVLKISTDLGDAVAAGGTLAEIDSPDYALALANARTSVGNLMAADKALARTLELKKVGAYAQKDVETAEAAYIAALAERDRAAGVLANYGGGDKIYSELARARSDRKEASEAQYAGAGHNVNSHYILKSPLAGVMVEKNINPGQEIRPDMMLANAAPIIFPLFVVADPSTLWLQVDVAESDLLGLQEGLGLRVYSQAFPSNVFTGTITKISATMDPLTRTVKIRGVINNPNGLLRAEMYVLVDIVRSAALLTEAGVNVPAKALFMKGDDSYLFIEETPGAFRRVKVMVGIEKDDIVPIFQGVTAGQKVVTEGALLLQSLIEPAG